MRISPSKNNRRFTRLAFRYGLAVATVAFSYLFRRVIDHYFGQGLPEFITFYPAVVASAFLWGIGPGLLSVILSALLVAYALMPPLYSFGLKTPIDVVGEVIFILVGVATSIIAGVYHRNRQVSLTRAKELRDASFYARNLIEVSLDPLVTIDPQGKISDVNHATELATGRNRVELIGSDFSDYFTEPEAARAGYLKVFSQGSVRDYPLVLRHVSGKTAHVLYNASVYKDIEGNVQGIFAAARDVTERKRAEELREAASTYARRLIEASLDPLVTISPEGKITDVNKATESVTGVPRDQLIGSDFSNYFTEPSKAREGYRRVFSEGSVTDYPLAIRHTSGTVCEVLYNATVYRDITGKPEGVFAAARDVTQRNRAEKELALYQQHLEKLVEQRTAEVVKTAKELEQSNKDLEQFAYVASHDLQEPLRAVAGFISLLQKRYEGKLDEKAHEYIRHAVDGATRMQALIDGLLAYSRVETKGAALAPSSAQQSYEVAMANLRTSVEEAHAEVTADSLPKVRADGLQLTQLFQNLIGNAIKFRGERPPRVHVSAKRQQKDWLFSVRDSGIGIDPQYADRIFRIFQRLHTRTQYPGTGIGLAICKKIVERHGGEIWFESKPGRGTTFYFSIPESGVNEHGEQ